ncbi:hypothetical protein [Sorangium sp. So ce1024]|uniref:hypothetical protein n=1 Tax=unclassified Sorangium TaxID=2621164 RepID=UPI003EFE608D
MNTDTLTFQAAFARLLTDPREIALLYGDPAGFAERHALDARQMAALRAIDERRLRWAADGLGLKRFLRMESYYPATLRLLRLHGAISAVERSFIMAYRPIKSERWSRSLRDALWFAEHVERLIDEGELEIACLADVLRCEHAEFLLWSDAAFGESANEFKIRNSSRPALTREEVLDAAVRVGPHVALRAFSCDVLPLVQALARGAEPPAPRPAPTLIVFGRVPGDERVQKARVGRMMEAFLARADGSRTTREILAEILDPRMGDAEREAMEQGCCQVLLQLRGLHFVTTEAGARRPDLPAASRRSAA